MSGYYTIIYNVNITKNIISQGIIHRLDKIISKFRHLIVVILTLYYNNSLNHDAVMTDYDTIMASYGT